jgi:hypothetical protein
VHLLSSLADIVVKFSPDDPRVRYRSASVRSSGEPVPGIAMASKPTESSAKLLPCPGCDEKLGQLIGVGYAGAKETLYYRCLGCGREWSDTHPDTQPKLFRSGLAD